MKKIKLTIDGTTTTAEIPDTAKTLAALRTALEKKIKDKLGTDWQFLDEDDSPVGKKLEAALPLESVRRGDTSIGVKTKKAKKGTPKPVANTDENIPPPAEDENDDPSAPKTEKTDGDEDPEQVSDANGDKDSGNDGGSPDKDDDSGEPQSGDDEGDELPGKVGKIAAKVGTRPPKQISNISALIKPSKDLHSDHRTIPKSSDPITTAEGRIGDDVIETACNDFLRFRGGSTVIITDQGPKAVWGHTNLDRAFTGSSLIESREVTIWERGEYRADSFRSETLADTYRRGFENFALGIDAEVKTTTASIGGALKAANESLNEGRQETGNTLVYTNIVHRIPKLTIRIPEEMVSIKPSILAQIRRRVASDSRQAFREYMRSHVGICVALTYDVGGKLMYTKEERLNQTAKTSVADAKKEIAGAIKGELKKGGGGGKLGISGGHGKGGGSTSTSAATVHSVNTNISYVGGAPFNSDNDWLSSLAEYGHWDVIAFDDFQPIWRFLKDPDLERKVVEKLALDDWKKDVAEQLMGDAKRLQTSRRFKAQQRDERAAQEEEQNGPHVEFGIRGIEGADERGVVLEQAGWVSKGGLARDSFDIVLPPDRVVTWYSMHLEQGGGSFHIIADEKTGLGEQALRVRTTGPTSLGHSGGTWIFRFETAPRQNVEGNERDVRANELLLRALSSDMVQ